jgi:hypothetical protein
MHYLVGYVDSCLFQANRVLQYCTVKDVKLLMHQMSISSTKLCLFSDAQNIWKTNILLVCIKLGKKQNKTEYNEMESNPSKYRATCMHEGEDPSFWNEFCKNNSNYISYVFIAVKDILQMQSQITAENYVSFSLCHFKNIVDKIGPLFARKGSYCVRCQIIANMRLWSVTVNKSPLNIVL